MPASPPPGLLDDGYFGPDSMLRRVISETLVGLSAPRVLLMQAAHPVAFAGFFAHTGALDDPYERLNRTTLIMNTVGFGTREGRRPRDGPGAADAYAGPRRAHRAGREVALGTPYAADDPDLLLWILATLADGGATVYRRWVGGLDRFELERLWQDYRVVGRLFGIPDDAMPASWLEFEDYWDGMLTDGSLHVTPQARELAIEIVMHPPLPLVARPLVELVNQVTIGSLPAVVREQYGFGWDPVRGAGLAVAAEATKRFVHPFLPWPATPDPRGSQRPSGGQAGAGRDARGPRERRRVVDGA
jgi:uncharacterized protein (DUF2236 family)